MRNETHGIILLAAVFLMLGGLIICGPDLARSAPPIKSVPVKATTKNKVTPLIVEPQLKCPKLKPRLRSWILKRLGSTYSYRWRRLVSTRLSAAIVKEASRFKVDPLVMATIAWIESDYRPYLKGPYRGRSGTNRRAAEVGAFQLIPGDFPVRKAWLANVGCKPRQKQLHRRWQRYVKRHGTACHAPDIVRLRSRTGLWNRYELRDLRIGTYIAASEIRYHIERSITRYPSPKWPRWSYAVKWRKRNPKADEVLLTRHSFYNTGTRRVPRRPYRYKLLSRYPKVRDYVCGERKIARR